MANNWDGGDHDLIIAGRVIEEFTGGSDVAQVKSPNPNIGPGERRFGWNHRRNANGVDFSFTIRQTSRDKGFVEDLVRDEDEVLVKFVVARNLDKYNPGQEIAAGAQKALITGGGTPYGNDDAQDITYNVSGIGYIRDDKPTPN